ncbi:MAG: DEAD/DEAH box helicase [Treponema sp.]|jgi:superfamily II DNA/RNA helicase|nr:DEAD/DEAH box helicase [Treponema sp.]
MENFDSLGIDTALTEKLAQRNIREPTKIQKLVIPHIFKREDVLFQSATGTGKTFAYLLPLLLNLPKELVVIAPTLELCSQIKREAEFLGQKACLLIGSANISRQIETLKKEKPSVIVGNGARLLQLAHMGKLKFSRADALVLDEGDRLVSDEQIAETTELVRLINPQQTIACSATITGKLRERLLAFTRNAVFLETAEHEILRERINHWALFSENRKKLDCLCSFLAAVHAKKILVFTNNSGQIGNIVARLQYHGVSADGLFSGVKKGSRKQAFDDFRRGRLTVLVSSDLAARGLDIPDVTHVISIDAPFESEDYIHRAGRTARAGKKGVMVTIGNEEELQRLSRIEKKLGVIVYPKVLYGGRIVAADTSGVS